MHNPLRILYVSSYYEPAFVYGGPVISGSAWCEMLAGEGMQVKVLTTNANGRQRLSFPLRQTVEINRIPVQFYPLDFPGYFYSRQMSRAIWEQVPSCDLVVIQAMWGHSLVAGARAALHAGVPYCLLLHGQLLPWSLRHKAWKKKIYLELVGRRYLDRAAGLQCTDEMEADAVHTLGVRAPTFIVPHVVNDEFFQVKRNRGKLRQRFQIPDQVPLLLYLGRLHEKKNPLLALDGLQLAGPDLREAHLVFVGPDEGGWVKRLSGAAARLGLEGRLHFTGLLERQGVIDALSDADLLLMPSALESENFGMSAAEAMAAGVPVLTSPGVPVGVEAQAHGAGLVVAPSALEIGKSLAEIFAQPGQLHGMGDNGRQYALAHYSTGKVAQHLSAQVQALAEIKRPLPGVA